jgi:hypothetical protein
MAPARTGLLSCVLGRISRAIRRAAYADRATHGIDGTAGDRARDGGCTTYYRVTDPSSGRMYYTTEITRRGSAVEFTDAKSGSNVTLQNSEVKEISSEDYQKNTAK